MHKRATLMMGNGWRVPRVRKLQPIGRHKKTLRGSQVKLADELTLKPIPQPQTFYANEAWNVKDTQKQGVKMSVDQKQSSPFQEEQKERKQTGTMWVNRPEQRRPLGLGSGDGSGSPMQGWGRSCGAADWRCGPLRSRGWAWMNLRTVPLPHLESQREADCKGGTTTSFFHLRKKRAVPALLESAWLPSWGFKVITSWPDTHS